MCSPRFPMPTLIDTTAIPDLQQIRRGHSLTVPVSSLFDETSLAASRSNSLPDSASHICTASDTDQSQMVKTSRNVGLRGFSHTLPVANRGTSPGPPLSARRPSSLRTSIVSSKLACVPRAETFCAVQHQTNSFNTVPPMRGPREGMSNESQYNGFDRLQSMQTRVLQAQTVPPTNLSATSLPLKTGLLHSDIQIANTMVPWSVNSPLRMGLAGIKEEAPPDVHQLGLIASLPVANGSWSFPPVGSFASMGVMVEHT